MTAGSVVIDFLPEALAQYREGYAIVAIDVIRATTTAVTAAATGRRCFPEPTIEGALARAATLERPLLVGELGGNMPFGFDLTNSPAQLLERSDVERPMILLSSSGTQLIGDARDAGLPTYLACFRNFAAVAAHLAPRHRHVAVIGAGTRGEFREEDQMCCAWVAEGLLAAGFRAEDARTQEIVDRWRGQPAEACRVSKSVDYLRRSEQLRDLDFILAHVNDLRAACLLKHGEAVLVAPDD
jgi:2-phosphosulfolactate phosphatase